MDRQPGPTNSTSDARAAASFRVLARVLATALMVVSLAGCQIVVGVLQILQGFPKNTCEFTLMTKKTLAEKGKKVVVLSSSNAAAQSEEPSLDLDIIAEFSRQLLVEKVDVVDPHKVTTFIDDYGGITEDTPLEPIGLKFKADYIVLFKFDDFGYLEERSPSLYRGHASYRVLVVEMVTDKAARGGKRAKIIYNKPHVSKYPANQPISAEQIGSPDIFKRQYMARLSQEIGHLFIDHRLEDEI
jgi:hypothetical protein